MPLIYNGTTVTDVVYNGVAVTKVVYNGTTVYEKITSRTYGYLFSGVLCGESSGISGSYPSTTGIFRINSTYGAMWCMNIATTDFTGFNTTFSNCMAKNITSMKMYVYRNNAQTFNTTAANSGWIYNTPPTSSGAKALIMSSSSLNAAGYTHVDTTTPVPATAGFVQASLDTSQLVTCFRMTPTTISSTAGHSPTSIPAGTYLTIGLRGLYSNTPQFKWLGNDSTYGYIEITADG